MNSFLNNYSKACFFFIMICLQFKRATDLEIFQLKIQTKTSTFILFFKCFFTWKSFYFPLAFVFSIMILHREWNRTKGIIIINDECTKEEWWVVINLH